MHESTCNNRTQLCAGRGPGWPDHFASTLEIARRQTAAAQRLYDEAHVPLRGPVQVRNVPFFFVLLDFAFAQPLVRRRRRGPIGGIPASLAARERRTVWRASR